MGSLNLGDERYVNLATFRRSGVAVCTPVWVAEHNGAGYVFSAGDAGKVKRIRNNGRVQLAACDARGKVHGEWLDGTARLVEDQQEIDAMYPAFSAKYGVQMWIADFFSRLTGRYRRRAIIAIELD